MKKKLVLLLKWLESTPVTESPRPITVTFPKEPIKPCPSWTKPFLFAFMVVSVSFALYFCNLIKPNTSWTVEETPARQVEVVLGMFAAGVGFFVLLGIGRIVSKGQHRVLCADQWKQYDKAVTRFNSELVVYHSEMTRFNAENEKYQTNMSERADIEKSVEIYQRILAFVDKYGKEQAVLEIREFVPPNIYKEFLMEHFGLSAVFQFEQLEQQQIQTTATVHSTEFARQTTEYARQTAVSAENNSMVWSY